MNRLGGIQAQANTYSHATTTCLKESNDVGIMLVLRKTIGCAANPYPRVEIEIRKLPITVGKDIIIGPDNWAFRCLNTAEPCEQVPSGLIVFDYLENAAAGLKTKGHYELRLRGGADVVERGDFKVDCIASCGKDLKSRH